MGKLALKPVHRPRTLPSLLLPFDTTADAPRYASPFSVPTAPFPESSVGDRLWDTTIIAAHFNDFTDKKGHTITTVGSPTISSAQAAPLTGNTTSALFNGNGDYLTTYSTLPNDLTSGPISIDLWVRPTGQVIPTGNTQYWHNPIISQSTSAGSGEQYIYIRTDRRLSLYRGAGWGASAIDITGTATIPDNVWTHIAVVWDGTHVRFFINGALDTVQSLSTFWINNGQPLYLFGVFVPSFLQYKGYFNGYVNDLRISKTGTAPTWVDKLGHTVTRPVNTNNSATISTSQYKFNSSSAYFDGNGDYIRVPYYSGISPAGNMTLETWIMPTDFTASRVLFSFFQVDAVDSGTYVYINTSGKLGVSWSIRNYPSASPNSNTVTVSSITANVWTHVAIVKNGLTVKIYLNGVLDVTGTLVQECYAGTGSDYLLIGKYRENTAELTTDVFKGYMDDVAIYKDIMYSSNFTPAGPIEI